MSRRTSQLLASKKSRKRLAVLLCCALLLATVTPVTSADGGWRSSRVSMGSLYLAALDRSAIAGTITLGRFLLLELALAWIAPGAVSSSHLSFAQDRSTEKARAPEGAFPPLGEIVREQRPVYTPFAIPSSVRARRNPLQPREGKKVGDPGTTLGTGLSAANVRRFGHPGESDRIQTQTGNGFGHSANERRISRKNKSSLGTRRPEIRSHHAYSPAPIGDATYVQNFFSWALVRTANANEMTYWNDILRSAYANGQPSMVMAARELGKTLFESEEYAARDSGHRLDLDAAHTQAYVTDLYQTYLLRAPDSGGLAYWSSQVPVLGHEAVRRAFDESGEFVTCVSTITPTGTISSAVSSLLSARAHPKNQPGNGLLTRDAAWSMMLVSLPGRAGMDLGLGLSYSSAAVWTRSGPYVYFDEDRGYPSPGFRLGFPTIQERFWDAEVGKNAYLMITPSGARVELRQVGTTTTYEAADSSYLKLTDNSASNPAQLIVRSTDGTRMTYAKYNNNEWRCTQVKDRNGNFITINYNWLGNITTVIDTLYRTIEFHYDGNANLVSLRQTWNGQTHELMAFGWGTTMIQPGLSGVVGIANGTQIPVLNLIWLDDGTYYKFFYPSASTGQMSSVTRYRSGYPGVDNDPGTTTTFVYGAADDSLRLSATRVSAVNWTGINGVPNEVQTNYGTEGSSGYTMTTAVGLPESTLYKEFYGTGWQRGLVWLSEVWSGGVKQKWTTPLWTQDNTGVNYELNPRITETNLYDATNNRRRVTIDYTNLTLPSGTVCKLPSDVREFQADASTLYRRTHTDYITDTAYLNEHLIGLRSGVTLYQGESVAKSITLYRYDWASHLEAMPGGVNPAQHDAAYNTNFTTRGNLVSVQRVSTDPNDPPNTNTEFKWGFNVSGSVTFTRDHDWHQNFFSYTDSFSADGVNSTYVPHVTFAYPTAVTDGDGFTSSFRYHYDLGVNTRKQGPPPAGQTQGLVQTTVYDWAGRVERVTTVNNGAYRRFWYGPGTVTSMWSVNNVADEAYLNETFDGLGRPLGTATYHPNTQGWYKAVVNVYDSVGRKIKQSNPTEINGSWVPTGDDAGSWKYTEQTYDWRGRPLRTTHPDSAYREVSYQDCGCAGGEVATMTDEGTLDAGAPKRRQQKVYADPFGRHLKTEILNWQGGSVYSATVNSYNVRDQVTQVRQFAGPEGSATYQDTTMTYDGYGRLKTRHLPEQNSGTATTWDYNADDTLQKITDARGASQTFAYSGRHLVTGITYAATGGITIPTAVAFGFDGAGNRTSMSDGAGATSYTYDQLSRLTSESRTFTGVSGSYGLSYQYNLISQLKELAIPFTSQTVAYNHDVAGQLTSVGATGFSASYYDWQTQQTVVQTLSSFASNISYRAWDMPKSIAYGNNTSDSISYNARLQPTNYAVSNVNYLSQTTMSWAFDYYADGRLHHAYHPTENIWDRSYAYDHAGRLKKANTNRLAREESWYWLNPDPYEQNLTYDVWGNSGRAGRLFSENFSAVGSYTNNRRYNWGYDADGNVTNDTRYLHKFDAAGIKEYSESDDWVGDGSAQFPLQPDVEITQSYDGDGQSRKRVQIMRQNVYDENENLIQVFQDNQTSYLVRSSVLGGATVVELAPNGQGGVAKKRLYVYAGGQRMATEEAGSVTFEHNIPGIGSWITTNGHQNNRAAAREERDPRGAEMPLLNPYSGMTYVTMRWQQTLFVEGGDPFDFSGGYMIDGLPVTASEFNRRVGGGSAGGGGIIGGRRIFVDLTGRSYLTHINVIFDVFVSATERSASEMSWYLGSIAFEFSLSTGQAVRGAQPQDPIPRPGPDPTDRSRSLTGSEERVAHEAIDAARARLTGACLDFIKANSKYDPLEVLDNLQQGGGFRYRDNPAAVGEIKHGGLGSSDTIFLTNSFFNAGPAHFVKGSMIVLDAPSFQQEVILHELRHALIGRHPIGGSFEDYNRGIRENCFKPPAEETP